MKVGVLTVPLQQLPLVEALEYLASIGVEAVEIGTGGFPGNTHCDPAVLLASPDQRRAFSALFRRTGITLAALSCHGNPVHPDKTVAEAAHKTYVDTVRLAGELGVSKVVTFSGCPGDSPGSRHPNWVTCPWPEEFLAVLDYQWNDCLLPYWREAGDLARSCGAKVALEMHPGFCVYNTASMRRIRREIGDVLGANLDPSHLIWQGNDIVASVRELAGAIYHVHAKDCKLDALNTGAKGVLDTVPYGNENERSWLFRTVGYGNGLNFWKDFISALRIAGYDDVISIEHEDSLMSIREGLEKAVALVRQAVISEQPAAMWWA